MTLLYTVGVVIALVFTSLTWRWASRHGFIHLGFALAEPAAGVDAVRRLRRSLRWGGCPGCGPRGPEVGGDEETT
jgi:hypothetical protein